MRVSLIVWIETSLTWCNVLNFTLYNYLGSDLDFVVLVPSQMSEVATVNVPSLEEGDGLEIESPTKVIKKAEAYSSDMKMKENVISLSNRIQLSRPMGFTNVRYVSRARIPVLKARVDGWQVCSPPIIYFYRNFINLITHISHF